MNKSLQLQIAKINRVHTDKMIDAGMSPTYFISVEGNYPRTDRVGHQCTVSMPEATLAIHLESTMVIPSGKTLAYNIELIKSDPDILEQFIGGMIRGVLFQPQGTSYKLTEFSKEVKDETAVVGEERIVKDNRFSLEYGSFGMVRNAETRKMHIEAKAQAEIYMRNKQANVFAGVFGGAQPAAIEVEAEVEPTWNKDLDSMVAYAAEHELDISSFVTATGALKANKKLDKLETAISAML